jgi:membrane protease YdiL (CAAX protease family)
MPARNRKRALLLLIAVLLSLWTAWSTLALPHLPPTEGLTHALQGLLIRLLLWVLPCAVYLWTQHRRFGFERLALLPPSATHWAFALGTIAIAGVAISLDVAHRLAVPPSSVWLLLVEGTTVGLPFAEFLEELVFRGVILSELLGILITEHQSKGAPALRSGFWMANLVTSLTFTGLHWPWWIYTEGFGQTFLLRSGGVFLLSMVLGMLFVRTRSIWPCFALHWLNNALSALTLS